jgi:hypothetical protein
MEIKIFYLELTKNMLGKIKPSCVKRIENYLNNPTIENWDNIYSILITPNKTIWQSVIAIDKNFPKFGRKEDINGNILKEWEQIPSPQTVKTAIQNMIMIKNNQLN